VKVINLFPQDVSQKTRLKTGKVVNTAMEKIHRLFRKDLGKDKSLGVIEMFGNYHMFRQAGVILYSQMTTYPGGREQFNNMVQDVIESGERLTKRMESKKKND